MTIQVYVSAYGLERAIDGLDFNGWAGVREDLINTMFCINVPLSEWNIGHNGGGLVNFWPKTK